jgi:hypothetical protein
LKNFVKIFFEVKKVDIKIFNENDGTHLCSKTELLNSISNFETKKISRKFSKESPQ